MFSNVLPTIIGGLGIFLVALKLLTANMNAFTNDYIRGVIKKSTSSSFKAVLWGCIMGFFAIDPIVVICIAASLCSCKSISLKKAMVMCTWSNLGACFLFFIAFINLDLMVLYVLGVVGLSYFLEKPFHLRHFMGSIFAVMLMLYALMLMKGQSEKMLDIGWIYGSLAEIQSSIFGPFFIAALLTLIVQSDLVVLVLTASLAQGHVISPDQTIFMIFGTQLGLGLASLIITFNVKGITKQLAFVNALLNLSIGGSFALLFMLELYFEIPIIRGIATKISENPWSQIVFVIFFTNIIACGCFSIFINPLYRWINKLLPHSKMHDPATPKFIFQANATDPESSLDLLEQELLELLQRLPINIELKISHLTNSNAIGPVLKLRHEQFIAVFKEIEGLLRELDLQQINTHTANKMLNLAECLHIIVSLENDTYHLTQVNWPATTSKVVSGLALKIYEVQQAHFNSILRSIQSGLGHDMLSLKSKTKNINITVDEVRKLCLKREKRSTVMEKSKILQMAGLLERNLWLLDRFADHYIFKDIVRNDLT